MVATAIDTIATVALITLLVGGLFWVTVEWFLG
jgi:hypothetical protein